MPAPMDNLMLNDHSATTSTCGSRSTCICRGARATRMGTQENTGSDPALGTATLPSAANAASRTAPAQSSCPSLQEPPAAPSGKTRSWSTKHRSRHKCSTSTCKAVLRKHPAQPPAADCVPVPLLH